MIIALVVMGIGMGTMAIVVEGPDRFGPCGCGQTWVGPLYYPENDGEKSVERSHRVQPLPVRPARENRWRVTEPAPLDFSDLGYEGAARSIPQILGASAAVGYPWERGPFDGPEGGTGPGRGVPSAWHHRFDPDDRVRDLEVAGLNAKVDGRVEHALAFLRSRQAEDGSWPGGVGNTALAVLAHLGHGHCILSPDSGDALLTACEWLMAPGRADGLAGEDLALLAWCLAEMDTLHWALRIEYPKLREPVEVAGAALLDAMDAGAAPTERRALHLIAIRALMQSRADVRGLKQSAISEIDALEKAGSEVELATFLARRVFRQESDVPVNLLEGAVPTPSLDGFLVAFAAALAGEELPVNAARWAPLLREQRQDGSWAGEDVIATTAWGALVLESPYRVRH